VSRKSPTREAASKNLSTAMAAYGLHTAVGLIVERMEGLLSGGNAQFSQSEKRRLALSRATLRATMTHLSVLFSPAADEPDDCRIARQEVTTERLAKLRASRQAATPDAERES